MGWDLFLLSQLEIQQLSSAALLKDPESAAKSSVIIFRVICFMSTADDIPQMTSEHYISATMTLHLLIIIAL